MNMVELDEQVIQAAKILMKMQGSRVVKARAEAHANTKTGKPGGYAPRAKIIIMEIRGDEGAKAKAKAKSRDHPSSKVGGLDRYDIEAAVILMAIQGIEERKVRETTASGK